MKEYLKKIQNGKDLSEQEAEKIAHALFQGNFEEETVAALLKALAEKGESVSEITGFAKAMRKKSVKIPCDPENTMDTCGTGGSGLPRFNTSTFVAFILASLGVPVLKHGNRAASGRCGSFDVLASLDLSVENPAEKVSSHFEKMNLGFLFAPLFHPAMKFVAGIRKKLGIRTIYNLLGPLSNPGLVKRQVIGVTSKFIAEKMIQVLKNLGHIRALVVAGEDGLDEVTVTGKTLVYELKDGKITSFNFDPRIYGINPVPFDEIRGGTAEENSKLFLDLLAGRENGARKNLVILNAAFGLLAADFVQSIKEGILKAKEALESGKVKSYFENYKKLLS